MAPTYSFLIVGHKSRRFLSDCLGSLLAIDDSSSEVLFLDNGSPEGEGELVRTRFPHTRVRVFDSPRNLFFAGGANLLAGVARGRYLVFLNPDTVAAPSLVHRMDEYLERTGACVAQLDLREQGGKRQSAGYFIDRLGFIVHAPPLEGAGERMLIFAGIGAALVVRRDLFERMGGFDESFQMYYEETDLCWRLHLAGHDVDFIEGAAVLHLQGGSGVSAARRETYFVRNRIWSLFKNQELGTLLVHLPLHLVVCLAWGVRELGRNRSLGRAVLRGVVGGVLGLPRCVPKRWRIQSLRRVTDRALVERGLIRRGYKYRLLGGGREGTRPPGDRAGAGTDPSPAGDVSSPGIRRSGR